MLHLGKLLLFENQNELALEHLLKAEKDLLLSHRSTHPLMVALRETIAEARAFMTMKM